MSFEPPEDPQTHPGRHRLERAGRFQWFHWLVILLSVSVTIFAWRFSTAEHDKRVEQRFDREVEQVRDLILDRMRKYEDALWAGTAMIQTSGGDVDFLEWKTYANSIQIESKYPGINGIGVIHYVPRAGLPAYLARQRELRPDFRVHPEHPGEELYPITYIIPVRGNEQAVGLDIAHETNRHTAAGRARDSGTAQITGPITLVQDAEQTPGFLFYAPYYEGGRPTTEAARRRTFTGMVYAPFVVRRLMEGVLSRERRQVGVRISDGPDTLYDENVPGEQFYDPNPMFVRTLSVPLYGRTWDIEIRSASSFRLGHRSNQPLTILFGGIVIDIMLIGLFVSLTRSARRALRYADAMTEEVERRAGELEELNAELEHRNRELDDFAHIASHDLKEPLRGIRNYATFLQEDYEAHLDEDGQSKLKTLTVLSERLSKFIDDLLRFSRVGREELQFHPCDTGALVADVVDTLEPWFHGRNVRVEVASDMPNISCHAVFLGEVFRNLITNAVKYNDSEERTVMIGWKAGEDNTPVFYVRDNGIGIAERHREGIFRIFKRLHGRDEYGGGTGAGLTVAKKIVERHNGRMWVESEIGMGTSFYFTLENGSE